MEKTERIRTLVSMDPSAERNDPARARSTTVANATLPTALWAQAMPDDTVNTLPLRSVNKVTTDPLEETPTFVPTEESAGKGHLPLKCKFAGGKSYMKPKAMRLMSCVY